MSKYKGIDERQIKCCDTAKNTIESGISFDTREGEFYLRFHFLELIKTWDIVTQKTKSMKLDKENIEQLMKELEEIRQELSPTKKILVWIDDKMTRCIEIEVSKNMTMDEITKQLDKTFRNWAKVHIPKS